MFTQRCLIRCSKFAPGRFFFGFRINANLSQIIRSRVFSTAPPGNNRSSLSKYSKHIVAGLAVATGSLAYVYLTRKEKAEIAKEEPEDEFIDVKFVDEHLDENLDLLEKHGPVQYLLIGGGTAAFAAFRAIRAKDETAKILVIGSEPFYPYMRPPLSKEIWFEDDPNVTNKLSFKQWNGRERSVFFEPEDFYCSVSDLLEKKNGGVSVIRGVTVTRIDPVNQVVFLDNGRTLSYKKCLFAPGGKPKNIDVFESLDAETQKHVTLFRNIKDFQKLHKILTSGKAKSISIVGGGFLGSELSCSLANIAKSQGSGLKITQIFPEAGNMGKVLPDYLSEWTTRKVCAQGVEVIPNATIEEVSKSDKKLKISINSKGEQDKKDILADHVVVAVGLEPRTEIASMSGLEIDEKHGGFLVNTELEARKNLWIAGDAACFYDVKLGRRRVEHHDHAVVSGRLAGENMTGSGKPYWHQSMFWSDLGPEIGYEAIGIVDSTLETVGVFSTATKKDTPKAIVEATGEGLRSEIKQTITEAPFENPIPRPPQPGDDYGKGVIFYLRNNLIVGVVLWNIFAKMQIARRIINEAKPNEDLTEVAKLFNLKDDKE